MNNIIVSTENVHTRVAIIQKVCVTIHALAITTNMRSLGNKRFENGRTTRKQIINDRSTPGLHIAEVATRQMEHHYRLSSRTRRKEISMVINPKQ